MTNDQRPTESTPLPAPVTGVARSGHGTGTALDDTQLYDFADLSPVLPAAAAQSAAVAAAQPLPPQSAVVTGPEVASEPEPPRSRTKSTSRTRRVGAPVAGLAGFALAAGLAILIGVVLGGVPMPDGAAAGGETASPTKAPPAETAAPAPDNGNDGGNGGSGGNNGNGNNGRGNGNDDD
ncbi:MAG TPA: hypothetical protein VMQ65_01915 [Candidatus Limnocylindria bacterium]|nr:hypothetical protein [Candidatus Limnocylindria bacterium]